MMGKGVVNSRRLFYLLMLTVLYCYVLYGYSSTGYIVFFDVGQGDASYISLTDDYNILIDGGPASDFIHKLHNEIRVSENIDLLIVTHDHEDHTLGLIDVVNRHSIGILVLPTSCVMSEKMKYIVDFAKYDRIVYSNFVELEFDSIAGAIHLDFGPSVSKCFNTSKDVNNSSVVFQMKYNDSIFVFTGDAEYEREKELLRDTVLHKGIEILKGGHHCSNTSSSYEFVSYLNPKVVVCSYDEDNRYGHPGDKTVSLFEKFGIERLDTATQGNIIINLE